MALASWWGGGCGRRWSDGAEGGLGYPQPVVFEVAHYVAALGGEVWHVDVNAERKIDDIARAALVLTHFEYGYIK